MSVVITIIKKVIVPVTIALLEAIGIIIIKRKQTTGLIPMMATSTTMVMME